MQPTSPTTRFIRAVWWRLICMRALEGAALGAGIFALASALAAAILLLEHKPTWPLIASGVALGALTGFAWALLKHPTKLQAAQEADRQLDLMDLLATAWLTSQSPTDDPFAACVIATADAQCLALSPSTLVLNRLGAQAWSGIGLSLALALTLVLISSLPTESSAQPNAQSATAIAPNLSHSREQSVSPREHTMPSPSPDSARDSSSTPASDSSPVTSDNPSTTTDHPDTTHSATGVASATTPAAPTDPFHPVPSHNPSAENGQTPAAGSATPAVAPHTPTRDAGGTAAITPAPATPPWRHDDWSQRQSHALESIQSNPRLDSYAPVIREYFDPEVQ